MNPCTRMTQPVRHLAALIAALAAPTVLSAIPLVCASTAAGGEPAVLSGTAEYTGSQGPVSAEKPIIVLASRDRTLDALPEASTIVDTNGGSFELTVPGPGEYYVAYLLDSNGNALPDLGEPFGIYENRINSPGDPITVPVSGDQANLALVFDDTAALPGVSGTVTYTGNMGPVDETRPIRVQIFREGDLTDRVNREQRLTNNGDAYSFILLEARLHYMQVFLDLNDNDALDDGEPFEIYPNRFMPPGDPLPEGIAAVDVVFGDGPDPTPTPREDLVVSGTVEYTGTLGPVSAEHPIFVLLFASPTLDGPPLNGALVTENGGEFAIGAPEPGDYYLAYLLDANGDGQPAVADPYELYADHQVPPGDAITVPTTGLSLRFDDTWGLPGVRGTITYTGALGPVSENAPIRVNGYRDAELTVSLEEHQALANNGDPYQLIILDGEAPYLHAFLDVNNNDVLDAGEPFTIYNGRTTTPGDPLSLEGDGIVDISFGDEAVSPTSTPTPLVTPSPAARCVGDCNGDGQVTVAELVSGVNIVLGTTGLGACSALDADGSETVTVDELVQAVHSILDGCPGGDA